MAIIKSTKGNIFLTRFVILTFATSIAVNRQVPEGRGHKADAHRHAHADAEMEGVDAHGIADGQENGDGDQHDGSGRP